MKVTTFQQVGVVFDDSLAHETKQNAKIYSFVFEGIKRFAMICFSGSGKELSLKLQ